VLARLCLANRLQTREEKPRMLTVQGAGDCVLSCACRVRLSHRQCADRWPRPGTSTRLLQPWPFRCSDPLWRTASRQL